MADASFKTVLVKDSILADITPDLAYAVQSGGAQKTYQAFPSTSASNSAIIFNVRLPSESVVMGRDILLSTGLTFRVKCGAVPVGETAFEYGVTDSLQAFPLNSLFTTATCQVNNTTVSINMQDVLPSLLRMNDSRELYRYNSMTPALPDQAWGSYKDAVGSNSNPMASYNNPSYDLDQVSRGSHPVVLNVVHNISGGGTDNSLVSTNVADTWVITIQTVICEPVFLSPFIWGNPEFNAQGILGVNNLTFTLNVDAQCKRLMSTGKYSIVDNKKVPYITSITLGATDGANGFTTNAPIGAYLAQTAPTLHLKFLSTQPTDLIETRNVVPFMDMPRFLSSAANNGAPIPPPVEGAYTTRTLTSSNIQLNQIPDLIVINVRKPMAEQNASDVTGFLTVNGLSINFNNQSGLLSSASAWDLWRLSSKNGSTQSWAEFSGQQTVNGRNGIEPTTAFASTTGSLIILNPSYDLSLPAYLACGSLGQYNVQFQIQVTNQFEEEITPEIIIICVNSGIMSTNMGTTSTYTGILTKDMVMSAKESRDPMSSAEHHRMVGGSMLNRLLTSHIHRKRLSKAPMKEVGMPEPLKMAKHRLKSMM